MATSTEIWTSESSMGAPSLSRGTPDVRDMFR
jgi:hypothetical protein